MGFWAGSGGSGLPGALDRFLEGLVRVLEVWLRFWAGSGWVLEVLEGLVRVLGGLGGFGWRLGGV